MAESTTTWHVFGQKTISAAGTAEQVTGTARRVRALTLVAHSSNSGRVYYGASDVDSSTQKGLLAGESITIDGTVFDPSEVYLDVDTGGEGADYVMVLAQVA